MRTESRSFKPVLTAVLLVPLFAATLAACDRSKDPTGDGQKVGGVAVCDARAIGDGVDAWAKTDGGGGEASLSDQADPFRCADGWAVAFADVGPKGEQVTVTVVLEAEGQFWIPKNREKVCGTDAGDSQVPESLYQDACQTN